MNKHIHSYRRTKLNTKYVMKCTKPFCTHYIHMNSIKSVPILKGKIAECPLCKEPFILNTRALKQAVPRCDKCVVRKNIKVKSAEEFFKELEHDVRRI